MPLLRSLRDKTRDFYVYVEKGRKKTPEGLHKCFTSHRIKDIKLSTLHDKKNVFRLRKNETLEDCADQVKTKRFTSDEKKTYTTIDKDVGSIRQDCASQIETERVTSDEKKKYIQLSALHQKRKYIQTLKHENM